MLDKGIKGRNLAQHTYGFQLRSLRKQRQRSISWLASQTRLSVSYISRLETGRRPIPSLSIRTAIANALTLTQNELHLLEGTLADGYCAFTHAAKLPGQVVVMVMNHTDAQELLGLFRGSITFAQLK